MEIGQKLATDISLDEDEILRVIHQEASRIMDTQNMYIALYDEKRNRISFPLAYMDGEPFFIEERPMKSGRTEWIIRNKKPILTYTRADAKRWYQQPGRGEYIGQTFASWLGVPIMLEDKVLGVVATYHKTEEFKYDPDHQKILMLMARQAAIALENARLVRELNRRIQELDELRNLSSDLTGPLTI
jgi:GAF domain-containing protein